jgi:hypothetical protein
MQFFLHWYAEKSAFNMRKNYSVQRCGWIWYPIVHVEFSKVSCRAVLPRAAAELKFFTITRTNWAFQTL